MSTDSSSSTIILIIELDTVSDHPLAVPVARDDTIEDVVVNALKLFRSNTDASEWDAYIGKGRAVRSLTVGDYGLKDQSELLLLERQRVSMPPPIVSKSKPSSFL